MKLFQARANIASVIGTDAALFRANVDQEIVDRRVSMDAVFACEPARHGVSRHGQQLGLVWIDIARGECYQRVPQLVD